MIRPHVGMLFRHAKYLDPDYSGRPLPCKVTRIAQGVVYYRAFYGYHDDGTEWLGSPSYIPIDRFNSIVGLLGSHDTTVGAADRRKHEQSKQEKS